MELKYEDGNRPLDIGLISVIVPVYNVENYLDRCIKSILEQSYTKFELLLIDDGSTDNSLNICGKYQQLDTRIRLFHKENAGPSDARNYGLDHMKGRYVTFIDSDDFVGSDYLRILYEMMTEGKHDSTILGVRDFYMEPELENDLCEDNRIIIENKDIFRELLGFDKFTWSPCGKLFRVELFYHNRFPSGVLYEDLQLIPYILCQCASIAYSSAKQYYYYINSAGSITHTINEERIKMWESGFDRLIGFAENNKPDDFAYLEARLCTCIFWDVIDRLFFSEKYQDISRALRKKYRVHLEKAWRLPGLTLKGKIKVYLFLINTGLYRTIRIKWVKRKKNLMEKMFLEDSFRA